MRQFLINIIKFCGAALVLYVLLVIISASVLPSYLLPNVRLYTGGYGHTFSRLNNVKEKNNIDVLFLGSSHTYRTFDTRNFKAYNTFNLGTNSQSMIQTKLLIDRYLKQLNPKMVVIETYPNNFKSIGVESTIDLISNSELDIEITKIGLLSKNAKVINALIYKTYTEINGEYNSFIEDSIKDNDTYIDGGFVEKELNFYKSKSYPKMDWEINPDQLDVFSNILSLLKQNNIPYILVQAPVTRSFYKAHLNNAYFDSIMKANGTYYNFNEMMSLDDSLYFYDHHHLNQNGVNLFNENVLKLIDSVKISTKD